MKAITGGMMMNIMLVCSAGMSTSMLVTKMEQAAKNKGLTVKIWASPEAGVKNYINGGVDVLLLGPQVRFLKDKLTALAEPRGIPVDVIHSMHYGMMNGEAVLQQALDLKKKIE